MSEFNEGDLVEAVKGDTVIRGRLSKSYSGLRIEAAGWGVENLKVEGYTVTLIEKATPPLPTEPGVYRDVKGGTWTLAVFGDWFHNGDGTIATGWTTDQLSQVHGVLPFTRLEPVPVTAKRVLDRISDLGSARDDDHLVNLGSYRAHIRIVATEFGVTTAEVQR